MPQPTLPILPTTKLEQYSQWYIIRYIIEEKSYATPSWKGYQEKTLRDSMPKKFLNENGIRAGALAGS